ncbi:hypothetical protein M8C21_017233, partial [Ambrosia artemisiifolia]
MMSSPLSELLSSKPLSAVAQRCVSLTNRARPVRHHSHLHRRIRCLPPSSLSIEDNAIFKLGE